MPTVQVLATIAYCTQQNKQFNSNKFYKMYAFLPYAYHTRTLFWNGNTGLKI